METSMITPAQYDEMTSRQNPEYLLAYMAAKMDERVLQLASVFFQLERGATSAPPPIYIILAHKLLQSDLITRSFVAGILESKS